MEKLYKNTPIFVILYILFMLPTYYLPYIGSNSYIIGITWAFWIHFSSLVILILLAWFRGSIISKPWLAIFPFLALIFDLAPLINNIPLIPTVMHLLAIILGAITSTETVATTTQEPV